jgi:hypothetical protein
MTGFLKDDLTVALDEVDRCASRIVTIYEDLSAITADPELAVSLRAEGERHREALTAFNHARRDSGQTPEVADPERAHIQSLWLVLKSAVSGEDFRQRLDESLGALDEELRHAIRAAGALEPEPAVRDALERLARELSTRQ